MPDGLTVQVLVICGLTCLGLGDGESARVGSVVVLHAHGAVAS